MKRFLLILMLCIHSIAAGKKEEAAPSREIIDIAQNLILQKDRDQAVRILSKSLLTEKNKTVSNEIRSILRDIGSLFLYDKAQQEFESSINFKKTEPGKWLASVEKAQKIEPDNTLIMMELIRNQLNKKSIDKAKEVLEEFRSRNPFDKNVIIAGIFVGLAAGDLKEYITAKTKLKDLQLENIGSITSYIDFLDKVNSGSREKIISSLSNWKKEDSVNPQISYWEGRLEGKPKGDEDSVCASFPEHLYRRYYYDLFFCSTSLEHFFKTKTAN